MIYESTRKATREELIERIKELEEGLDNSSSRVTALTRENTKLKYEVFKNKEKIKELIQKLDIDIERNKRRITEHIIDDTSEAWSSMLISYAPETVKRILEEFLDTGGIINDK